MRSIPLKTVLLSRPLGMPVDQAAPAFVYADTIEMLVRTTPAGRGLDLQEVRKGLAVIAAIERARSAPAVMPLLLEEAEYAYLLARLRDMRWTVADQAIVDFVEAIEGAPQIAPTSPA